MRPLAADFDECPVQMPTLCLDGPSHHVNIPGRCRQRRAEDVSAPKGGLALSRTMDAHGELFLPLVARAGPARRARRRGGWKQASQARE